MDLEDVCRSREWGSYFSFEKAHRVQKHAAFLEKLNFAWLVMLVLTIPFLLGMYVGHL
jgi:hypothetical protein